jgi:hypothetical protein
LFSQGIDAMTDLQAALNNLETSQAEISDRLGSLETDLQTALKTHVTAQNDYVAAQNDILKKLADSTDKFTSLERRVADKDERIQLLTDINRAVQFQNDNLQKQLTSRWSFLTGMLTVAALMFVVNFGYEVYRIKDVMDAKNSLETGSKNLIEGTRVLSENAVKYADVLTELAFADSVLSEGHRELLRRSYPDAIILANRAIEHLKSALKTTGFIDLSLFSNVRFEENCSLPINAITLVKEQLEDTKETTDRNPGQIAANTLSPRRLRPVVAQSLFNAYDLLASGTFFSGMPVSLRSYAVLMIMLDPSQWTGYHWAGIASSHDIEKNPKLEIACYMKSVSYKQEANKDDINLAEYYFTQGDYENSLAYSTAYRNSVFGKPSAVDIVADFYRSVAGYLTKNDQQFTKSFRETIQRMFKKNPEDVNLQGTFDDKDLNAFIDGPIFNKLNMEQRAEVIKTKQCLLEPGAC